LPRLAEAARFAEASCRDGTSICLPPWHENWYRIPDRDSDGLGPEALNSILIGTDRSS
jgi:hypothetical protein